MTFTVNNTDDVPDANSDDDVCETAPGNGVCTLRAAIQQSNLHDGADTIILQANVTYLLTRVGADDLSLDGDLDIFDSVTITGAGPTTVIDGNGGVLAERVFTIFQCIGDVSPGATCSSLGIVSVTMSGLTIQHGYSAGSGGGIYNAAKLTLQNCVVKANTVNGTNESGGGIYNILQLTLINSTVSGNISSGPNAYGGGIYDAAMMAINSSTISGNAASEFTGSGGGIAVNTASAVSIKNTTISSNSAASGGGISILNQGDMQIPIVNSTISGNWAYGNGGGVYSSTGFSHTGSTGLYNVTITKNEANADEIKADGMAGGVFQGNGTLYVANSIIAGNYLVIPTAGKPIIDPDQCSGTISSLGNNFLSDIDATRCAITGQYEVATVPLGPLQDNGGSTKTHALLPGNLAIDGGNMTGCKDGNGSSIAFDQRGEPRPNGPYCDAGAFEVAEIIFQDGFEPGP
jgi:CSLREA domain-containing protein